MFVAREFWAKAWDIIIRSGTSKKSTMHKPEEEGTMQMSAEGIMHATWACDLGVSPVNAFFMQLVKDNVYN